MQRQNVPASSATARATARIDTHASEYSPTYPALFAEAFGPATDSSVTLRVNPLPSRARVLEEIAAGAPTLAVLPASLAARAIADGLEARIVCAAVAPTDLAHADQEPPVPWDRFATGVRRLAPRAVLVAPERTLVEDPAHVGAAIRAYWRGAELATEAPSLLGVVLATEFGLSPEEAERRARRAVATWRLDPAVRLVGLKTVLDALRTRRQLTREVGIFELLDERFVSADRTEVSAAMLG